MPQNFMKKIFTDNSQALKFMKVFSRMKPWPMHAKEQRVKSPASIFPAVNAKESVVQTVLSSKVARGAKVKVIAHGALPPDPRNARLAARVTDDVWMEVTYIHTVKFNRIITFVAHHQTNNAILWQGLVKTRI